MAQPQPGAARRLRRALVGNAVFSAASALLFLLATESIAGLAGAQSNEIQQTGLALVMFVALLAVVASRPDLQSQGALRGAVLIAVLDVLWVLTAPLKMSGYTGDGRLLFGVITCIVLGFAIVQIATIQKLTRARSTRKHETPMPGY